MARISATMKQKANPKTKAPEPVQNESDSDDAPEAISQAASKAAAQRDEEVLKEFEAAEKARSKRRNQERDRKLKERALVTRAGRLSEGKDKQEEDEGEDSEGSDGDAGEEDGEITASERRMMKAMMEAEDEMDEDASEDEDGDGLDMDEDEMSVDEDDDEGDEDGEDEEEDAFLDEDEDADMDPEAEDEDASEFSDAELVKPPPKPNRSQQPLKSSTPKYLSDDLFASAFASQAAASKAKSKTSKDVQDSKKPARRRRVPRTRPKDIVIGSRTIRTLSSLSDPSEAAARSKPPPRINKFLDRTLALKGKKGALSAKARGWERRPANIGMMKMGGAPVGFVRNQS